MPEVSRNGKGRSQRINDRLLEEAADLELLEAVAEMKDPAAPMRVRRQYVETFKALNRMRQANGKPWINIRPRKLRA